MDGRRLVLNDGTVIEDGEAGYADGFLWCWIRGYSMQEAAAVFFDAGKTERIVFQYGDMEDTYEGYTNCTRLMAGTDGKISVCLTRGNE